jgi:hypothetical protein
MRNLKRAIRENFERAVGEQLRSLICPIDEIMTGPKGSTASNQEITGFRRKQEVILASYVDRKRALKDIQREEVEKKMSTRNRKRGPRPVLCWTKEGL